METLKKGFLLALGWRLGSDVYEVIKAYVKK